MKKVFSNSQVCHVWNSQSQTTGRNANGSIFFENNKIYSYGYHYCMAAIYYSEFNSERFVLTNSETYSITTCKQMHKVYNALRSDALKIAVPNPSEPKSEANQIHLMNNIVGAIDDALNMRKNHNVYGLSNIENAIRNFNVFNGLVHGPKSERFELPEEWRLSILDTMKAKEARDHEKKMLAEAKRERELAAERLKYAEQIALWPKRLNTERIPSYLFPKEFDLVRKSEDGTEVETSRGAKVPLDHALRLLNLVLNKQARIGERVGHFKVDEIAEQTLKIGCHTINIEQAKSVLLDKAA